MQTVRWGLAWPASRTSPSAGAGGAGRLHDGEPVETAVNVVDGDGRPQVDTNFQVHKHPDAAATSGARTLQNHAFWRYRALSELVATGHDGFTPDDLKVNNACVNVRRVLDAMSDVERQAIAANG